MIDKSKIGSTYQVNYNGHTFRGIIEEGREDFYRLIGVDCFDVSYEEMVLMLEVNGIKVKSNWKLSTVKKKYDAIK